MPANGCLPWLPRPRLLLLPLLLALLPLLVAAAAPVADAAAAAAAAGGVATAADLVRSAEAGRLADVYKALDGGAPVDTQDEGGAVILDPRSQPIIDILSICHSIDHSDSLNTKQIANVRRHNRTALVQVDATNEQGFTALQVAARYGHT